MSTTFETDDRIAGLSRGKPGQPAGERPGPAAWGRFDVARFNVALIAWQAALGVAAFLASGRGARNVKPAVLAMSAALDLGYRLAVVGVAAGFLAVFWRRFVATVAPTRPISYGEALAAVLMVGLLLGR